MVTADLGFAAIPADVKAAVSDIAGIIISEKRFAMAQDDGVEQGILLGELPKWVQSVVNMRRFRLPDWSFEIT